MRWLCFDALLLPADLVGLRFCAHIICSRPLIVETPSSRYLQPPPQQQDIPWSTALSMCAVFTFDVLGLSGAQKAFRMGTVGRQEDGK